MQIPVRLQLGIDGPIQAVGSIYLDSQTVGGAANWAGSYHVRSMGRHFDDYVVTGRLAQFAPIPGFPVAHPYERLSGKIRAAAVTGNIGETIAALFARRYLDAQIADIAHIKPKRPFARSQSPDYLMRIGHLMPGPFQSLAPMYGNGPEWWPIESKARTTQNSADQARLSALKQLTAYWWLIHPRHAGDVGFGMIVSLVYTPPRELRASLILPSDQEQLIDALRVRPPHTDFDQVRDSLHEC